MPCSPHVATKMNILHYQKKFATSFGAKDSVRRSTQRFCRCHVTQTGFPFRLNKACAGRRANKSFRIAPIHSVLRGPPHPEWLLTCQPYTATMATHWPQVVNKNQKSAARDTGPCVIKDNTRRPLCESGSRPQLQNGPAVPLLSPSLLRCLHFHC